MKDIPVLLIMFKRPDTALEVIKAIKDAKPSRLYIAADGPREGKPGEKEACEETRKTVLHEIDWDCQVFTLFHPKNLGCCEAPAKAITWFFENEEMGIILEDDCVPNPSFFTFCAELLHYYKDDERIMQITGFNDQNNKIRGEASYFFSHFPSGWGWASWRRAWKHYKIKPENVDKEYKSNLVTRAFYNNKKAAETWLKLMYYNLDGTWDYQWAYTIFQQKGLCITPNIALVRNIGFDHRATHTSKFMHGFTNIKTGEVNKIIHPLELKAHQDADRQTMAKRYYAPFLKRMYGKVYSLFASKKAS
jgi:hypothetical protein